MLIAGEAVSTYGSLVDHNHDLVMTCAFLGPHRKLVPESYSTVARWFLAREIISIYWLYVHPPHLTGRRCSKSIAADLDPETKNVSSERDEALVLSSLSFQKRQYLAHNRTGYADVIMTLAYGTRQGSEQFSMSPARGRSLIR